MNASAKLMFLCGKMAAGESFEAITAYLEPPSRDERFNVVRHARA